MKWILIMVFNALSVLLYAQNYVPGDIIIQLDRGVSVSSKIEEFAFKIGTNFNYSKTLSNRMNIHLLKVDSNINVEALASKIAEIEGVKIAQVNHTNIEIRKTPNDPIYPVQWANGPSATGRMYAPEAWDIATGGETVLGDEIVVAVIDGGADLSHEDISYFINENEIPLNGIDDDNNGYIDDRSGWDAYASDGTVPSDQHGTHVSGIIGANGNNGTGVVGVNWDVKILPIAGSSSQEATVIEAYGYALEMRALYNETNGEKGAYVVATNSSFGVNYGNPASYPLWCAFYDSLGAYGILSAGATANLNIDVNQYGDIPTTCPSDFLISVTNTTSDGTKLSGAGYSPIHIDLGAPGTEIYSTLPVNTYGSQTGTSMATPQVAGAIALMHSAICTNVYQAYEQNQDSLALWLKGTLLATVEQSASLATQTQSGGRLNLFSALDSLQNFNCIRGNKFANSDLCGDCSGEVFLILSEGAAPFSFLWDDGSTDSLYVGCKGVHNVTVTDALGFQKDYSVTMLGNDSITITAAISTPNGVADGSISVTPQGGNGLPYSYEWSTGDTGSSISNIPAGVYTLTITDVGGCTNEFVLGLFNTGTADVEEQTYLTVFPNPVSNLLHIKSSLNFISSVQLLDLTGKEVIKKSFSAQDAFINVSSVQPGLYVLLVELENAPPFLTKVTVK